MMGEVEQRLICRWCPESERGGVHLLPELRQPLDVRDVVSDSGWSAAPRIRDFTEIHFGQSICQVEGQIVPVADVTLSGGDSIYFEHHTMLWAATRASSSRRSRWPGRSSGCWRECHLS